MALIVKNQAALAKMLSAVPDEPVNTLEVLISAIPGSMPLDIKYLGQGDSKSASASITIEWISKWSAGGYASTLPGTTDVSYQGSDTDWQISNAAMYLNAKEYQWIGDGSQVADAIDIQAVITHELGVHHTSVPRILKVLHPLFLDDLRAAHDRNDEVLERIYIGRRFKNDTERLEKLFELYTKMTAGAAPTKAKKRRGASS